MSTGEKISRDLSDAGKDLDRLGAPDICPKNTDLERPLVVHLAHNPHIECKPKSSVATTCHLSMSIVSNLLSALGVMHGCTAQHGCPSVERLLRASNATKQSVFVQGFRDAVRQVTKNCARRE
jgi:hypothetical protein